MTAKRETKAVPSVNLLQLQFSFICWGVPGHSKAHLSFHQSQSTFSCSPSTDISRLSDHYVYTCKQEIKLVGDIILLYATKIPESSTAARNHHKRATMGIFLEWQGAWSVGKNCSQSFKHIFKQRPRFRPTAVFSKLVRQNNCNIQAGWDCWTMNIHAILLETSVPPWCTIRSYFLICTSQKLSRPAERPSHQPGTMCWKHQCTAALSLFQAGGWGVS